MPTPNRRHTVSVIMAARNCESTVQAAVFSALFQSAPPEEVVVVDDASTDATWDRLSELSHPSLRIYQSPNRLGRAEARNWALQLTSSEFVAIADSDDYSLPYRLAATLELLGGSSECVAAGGQLLAYRPGTGKIERGNQWPTSAKAIAKTFEAGRMGIAHPSALIRRDALEAVGGYRSDFTYSEDFEMFLRLKRLGTFQATPRHIVVYRRPKIDALSYLWKTEVGRRRALAPERHTKDALDSVRAFHALGVVAITALRQRLKGRTTTALTLDGLEALRLSTDRE